MGARFYDPVVGRFLSVDPAPVNAAIAGTFNRYSYSYNNPYSYKDPSGAIVETALDVVSVGLSLDAFIDDPGFWTGLGLAYDSVAVAVPFLPAGAGIARQVATHSDEVVGIVNRGGRFGDLDKAKLPGEVGHHMPQNAANKQKFGTSRNDGPAVGMTTADHAKTRTFGGKGKRTMREDAEANLGPRDRLAKDINDLRKNFGRQYNKGSLEAIDYAKTRPEYKHPSPRRRP